MGENIWEREVTLLLASVWLDRLPRRCGKGGLLPPRLWPLGHQGSQDVPASAAGWGGWKWKWRVVIESHGPRVNLWALQTLKVWRWSTLPGLSTPHGERGPRQVRAGCRQWITHSHKRQACPLRGQRVWRNQWASPGWSVHRGASETFFIYVFTGDCMSAAELL